MEREEEEGERGKEGDSDKQDYESLGYNMYTCCRQIDVAQRTVVPFT